MKWRYWRRGSIFSLIIVRVSKWKFGEKGMFAGLELEVWILDWYWKICCFVLDVVFSSRPGVGSPLSYFLKDCGNQIHLCPVRGHCSAILRELITVSWNVKLNRQTDGGRRDQFSSRRQGFTATLAPHPNPEHQAKGTCQAHITVTLTFATFQK